MEITQTLECAAAVTRCRVAVPPVWFMAAMTLGFAQVAVAQERGADPGSREDIYVLHSIREERMMESTWCTPQKAGSALLAGDAVEERFGLWSVRTMPETGRIYDAKTIRVGEIRTCTAATLDPQVFGFFAEGNLANLPFTGHGDCRLGQTDSPERGIAALRCHLVLRGLPPTYRGGMATSNTLVSAAVLGGETEPPGYLQASIATFRLWKALLVGAKEGDALRSAAPHENVTATTPVPASR